MVKIAPRFFVTDLGTRYLGTEIFWWRLSKHVSCPWLSHIFVVWLSSYFLHHSAMKRQYTIQKIMKNCLTITASSTIIRSKERYEPSDSSGRDQARATQQQKQDRVKTGPLEYSETFTLWYELDDTLDFFARSSTRLVEKTDATIFRHNHGVKTKPSDKDAWVFAGCLRHVPLNRVISWPSYGLVGSTN